MVMKYLFPPGVVVCIGPQTSVWIKSRISSVFDSDFLGKGFLVILDCMQHSHTVENWHGFMLIPDALFCLSSSLIACWSLWPIPLCILLYVLRLPLAISVRHSAQTVPCVLLLQLSFLRSLWSCTIFL